MKSILNKDIIRDIKKSRGRFLSILCIVALGVAFFSGIKISPMVMEKTSDDYYDDYNLMDLKLISTLGLTDEDVREVNKIEGVKGVFPTYSMDVLTKFNSQQYVLKVHGLPLNDIKKDSENYINQVNVVEGRLPNKSGECVVETSKIGKFNIPIGSKIKLSSGNDDSLDNSLKNTEYTVVGKIETPYYLSDEKGSSAIGSGTIDSVVMIPQDDFKMDAYTEIFLTVDGAKEENSYKDSYFNKVDKVTNNLKNISNERNEDRYNQVISEADEAVDKLAKVDNKIKDSEDEIKKIEKPEWYILDRNSHYSYAEYASCANSINALSKIFPVFFFSVAALVCLTTMTRMVDEQRINIGTLKALGYTKGKIAKKYILYALIASLTGSVIGIAIGFTVFPIIIFNAYGIMYTMPEVQLLFNLPLAMGVTITAVSITTLAAYLACYNELKETPSALMRPRAPKNGKRILIEGIPFIWDKIGFIGKVTIRNIFRYKKRFLMTVLGISGCTALILSGLGIQDSIQMIVDGQYGSIFKYDMTISIDNNTKTSELKDIEEDVSKEKLITDYQLMNSQNGKVLSDGKEKQVTIMIPKYIEEMERFIGLQDRKTQNNIELNNDGVVISEKVARDFGLEKGDTIELLNAKEEKVKANIIGVTENYVSHYVYMSKDYYKKLYNSEVAYNRIIGMISDKSIETENELLKKLIDKSNITGVGFNTGIKENFENTIKSLNYVVLIMTLSAGALAFVVLYNLTNVNISERIREIATIKVLGFYDSEVSAYVYRENMILTLIGTLVGLGLGKLLHQFIMVTVETESMMFGRVIEGSSYVMAAILTIILGLIVNFAMYYKLKDVEMVESLKSVD